jgi:hypothetical protein
MNDFVIDDAAVHFAASKNAEYRQRVKDRFTTFIHFLQDNGLAVSRILVEGEEPSETLKIMKSDLTEEGFEVVKASYDKWLRGIDQGKPIADITALEKSLSKLRG